MLKWCLIFSLVWHVFFMSCFDISMNIDKEANVYAVNFLGSILKEVDFLFNVNRVANLDAVNLHNFNNYLLLNNQKSSKLYSEGFKKTIDWYVKARNKEDVKENLQKLLMQR